MGKISSEKTIPTGRSEEKTHPQKRPKNKRNAGGKKWETAQKRVTFGTKMGSDCAKCTGNFFDLCAKNREKMFSKVDEKMNIANETGAYASKRELSGGKESIAGADNIFCWNPKDLTKISLRGLFDASAPIC